MKDCKTQNLFLINTFVFVIFLFSTLPVSANTLTFVSPESVSPKIIIENDVAHGTYVEIIRQVCKRMKVYASFEQYPWARAVFMVKNGKADAIFPPFKTDERREFLYFPSEPVSITRNVLFARKSSRLKIKKLEDLTGLIVGINDQYSYGAAFDKYKNNLKLDISRTEEMQIHKLAHKGKVRMDVAAASEEAFKYISKKLGKSQEFEIVYVISETPAYVAFSKAGGEKNKKLAEEFSRILIKLKKEGVVDEINDRYLK